jgi:hypothetical protein
MFQITSFSQESSNITSYCDQTFPSWSHDVTLRHWACFYGHRQTPVPPKVHRDPFHSETEVLRTSYTSCIETTAIKTNPKYTSFKLNTHLASQTTYVTNSMEQSPSWEANRSSAIQEISCILWSPKVTTFKNTHHPSLSWAKSIPSMPHHSISRRSILILSSHLCQGLLIGLFSSGLHTKTL